MSDIFSCSYCAQQVKLKPEQIGKVTRCPKCQNVVWPFANKKSDIASKLTSSWQYMRDRLLRKPGATGPIVDTEFLSLVADGTIFPEAQVNSPTFTQGQWVELKSVNLKLVELQIRQRSAEAKRVLREQERATRAKAANRQKLVRAIQQAVSDGRVSLKEREQIFAFRKAAGISENEVSEVLAEESEKLLQKVVQECLEDGVLEPEEKARISSIASGLGVDLVLSNADQHRFAIAEFAWLLANGKYSPGNWSQSVSLNKNEEFLGSANGEWMDIVTLKRPNGIYLGGDQYLKSALQGECILTNKRVLATSDLSSKKMTLSSVESIRWYRDGLFFNRSTGKSVFLRPTCDNLVWGQFALVCQYVRSGMPVQGILPEQNFIPEVVLEAELVEAAPVQPVVQPNYTFRVVGEFVGQREQNIARLSIGDPVRLEREPTNSHDRHAVMVRDSSGNELGYLKREVVSWFAPMLDRGVNVRAFAHAHPRDGGLIVGVFL